MENKSATLKTIIAVNNIAVICEVRKTLGKKINYDADDGASFKVAAVLEEAFALAIIECAKNIEIDC